MKTLLAACLVLLSLAVVAEEIADLTPKPLFLDDPKGFRIAKPGAELRLCYSSRCASRFGLSPRLHQWPSGASQPGRAERADESKRLLSGTVSWMPAS